MHSFESGLLQENGLLQEERRLASLEHGKLVPRPSVGVVLGAKDRGMG